ncbi:alpha/beta hydrolase [Dyadobacter chenwenxiniae]|uniref:Alpha/beta hydrolase n=1 Tax=Dyadobacter chenwenxiniae TaxID=2906456 RepID=A0A9X1THT5_9BACT|nr:alpha/beta hydrolase [Dyadobacter chenwenxiniae]MCF0065125.1 alpha/beta hydrolase [Dyadobacter chenwenxiniae]UON84603.1 alpha/beta hydrolase [Dyadobacter chenwenxiniae]
MKKCLIFLFILRFCIFSKSLAQQGGNSSKPDTFALFDKARNRKIPVAVYTDKSNAKANKRLAIVSHGYGQNTGGALLAYSAISNMLASNGFVVVSIQHELPSDSLLPTAGIPQVVRMPFWDRGADNILFVIKEFKKSHPELDYEHITLIGHSNGGDMSALFPQKYPGIVDKVITLDNRRMALPRTRHPKIYTLRSSDQPADEGVLPNIEEQKKFEITVIKLQNTIHNDMNDMGTPAQQKEINDYILTFIKQ